MAVTPFKYVIDAHIFALKNFENIVRLCLLAGVIGTVFTVLDFGNPIIKDTNEGIHISALLSWDVAVSFIVNFILSVMFSVPYIQYAHAKAKQPDANIRPNIQMSMAWNSYKTAFLIASIKVFAISVAVGTGLFYISKALSMPLIVSIIVFFVAMAFILRLQIMTSAAALGHDSSMATIWKLTKSYTATLVILALGNIGFVMIWGIVMTILSTPFFNANTLWADIVGVFIQTMLSYAMALAIAHSFLTLYLAIQNTHKKPQN